MDYNKRVYTSLHPLLYWYAFSKGFAIKLQQAAIERFNTDGEVSALLISLKAGGVVCSKHPSNINRYLIKYMLLFILLLGIESNRGLLCIFGACPSSYLICFLVYSTGHPAHCSAHAIAHPVACHLSVCG